MRRPPRRWPLPYPAGRLRSAAGGSDRHADAPSDRRTGISVAAIARARQQQVGDIRAGDGEHESGHREQQHEDAAHLLRFSAAFCPRAPSLEAKTAAPGRPARSRSLPMPLRRAGNSTSRMSAVKGTLSARLCLFAGEAGLEPAEDVQPVVVPAVDARPAGTHASRHRQRNEDLWTFHRLTCHRSPRASRRRWSSARR